jgi:hypothetical protein
MSKLRTISIDPQFLNMSKKKVKTQKTNIQLSDIKLNSNNIRELLLEKLKSQSKNKKTHKIPAVQLNTMDEQSMLCKDEVIKSGEPIIVTKDEVIKNIEPVKSFEHVSMNENTNTNTNSDTNTNINMCSVIQPDKPYGVLKNGNKPTFKTWNQSSNIPTPMQPISNMPEVEILPVPEPVQLVEEIEVKKIFELGRNKKNKSVNVLIKNNNTRKKIECDKINFKKTNLSTIKNFLKKQNLIKFGTSAPNNLLRDMYENSKLCCEIHNENSQNIAHNFKED